MEKNKKDKIKKRKNNKGYQSYTGPVTTRGRTDSAITLIALVITIVVLLILARSSNCNINGRKPD